MDKVRVLSAGGKDNVNIIDSDSNIFSIKDTKLYVPVVSLSAKDNQRLLKRLRKGFERSIGISIKQKVRI